jgi:hypothetical protein
LTETAVELARRIIKRGARGDVLALCRLVLRRAKRNAAQVREWRKANPQRKLVPDDGEHDDLGNYRKWEWRLLHRGTKIVEQQLQAALEKHGCPDIEVQVGGDRCYDTSIAFKYRASDEKPGPPELSLLFSSLPPVGSSWPAEQRKRWFEIAASMFDLAYGP